jgi:hypothetical protein
VSKVKVKYGQSNASGEYDTKASERPVGYADKDLLIHCMIAKTNVNENE